jgi:hypothetical protein
MRTLLVLALSLALTGSLFLTQTVIVHAHHFTGDGILRRSHLSAEQLQTYAGMYEFPQIGLNFRIWVEDGALFVQSANRPGPRTTLLPTGNDHFVSHEGGDVECWFDVNAGKLTFTQRGKTFTGQRQ